MLEYVEDPYALIGDLSFILSQYGAQFVSTGEGELGKMVAIEPVPYEVYVSFDAGWKTSARVYSRRK